MPDFIDLTGQKLGKLIVLKRSNFKGKGKKPHIYWDCVCECGNKCAYRGDRFKVNKTIHCGCLTNNHVLTHGMTKTREYQVWQQMKVRVSDTKWNHKKYYFDKGIDIDPRWEKSFEAFYEDMGDTPSPTHSIDRINNALGYWKFNCRWATRKEQQRNRDCNRLLTYKNKTQCIADWADELKIEKALIDQRLANGWDIERIFTEPKNTEYIHNHKQKFTQE